MYALGDPHPLREPCRRIITAHRDGRLSAVTTLQVLQEFAHVWARRRSRHNAADLARYWSEALPLLTPGPADLLLGLDLFERQRPLDAFDAVLAAVALNQAAEALVSADKAFGAVPGLVWIDPSTSKLDELLGAI